MESLGKDIKRLFGKTLVTEKRTRDGYIRGTEVGITSLSSYKGTPSCTLEITKHNTDGKNKTLGSPK